MINGFTLDPKTCHTCGATLFQREDGFAYFRYDIRWDEDLEQGWKIVRQCPNWKLIKPGKSNGHYRRSWIISLEGDPYKPPPPILQCLRWSG